MVYTRSSLLERKARELQPSIHPEGKRKSQNRKKSITAVFQWRIMVHKN